MGIGKPFQPGMKKIGGRVKGSRNRISEAFLKDLAAEWEASGAAALRVMAKEECGNFVKVVAALLPKELDDNELDLLITEVRARIRGAFISDLGSGEGTETHH